MAVHEICRKPLRLLQKNFTRQRGPRFLLRRRGLVAFLQQLDGCHFQGVALHVASHVHAQVGKTHKQIWQRLSDAGLDINCETFCRLIRRARKKRRISEARGGKSVEVPELQARQTATSVEHDPLANLRKVEASRPGFHFRGTENLNVLVHGRRESREQSKH